MSDDSVVITDVNQLRIEPGESRRVWLGIGASWFGSFRVPLYVAKGPRPGAKLVVLVCQHGDEVYGVLGGLDFMNEITGRVSSGEFWMVPCVNVLGFMTGSFVNPFDHRDMNRVHPGHKLGSLSEQIVSQLYQQVLPNADLVLDVHGGSLQVGDIAFGRWTDVEGKPSVFHIVACMDLDFLVVPPDTSPGSLGSAATIVGVPSISIEAGSCLRYARDNAQEMAEIVTSCMRSLGMLDGARPQPKALPHKRIRSHRSFTSGAFKTLVSMGEHVGKGQRLGFVMDLLGHVIQDVVAGEDGIVTVMRTGVRVHAG